MISVQNHHQLSNGSKILVTIASILLFSSCFATKKQEIPVRPPKTYYPEKRDTVVIPKQTEVIDTLEWVDIEFGEPVTVPEKENKKDKTANIDPMKKDQYKIDILIPMDSYGVVGELNDLEQNYNTYSKVQYYAGMIMALVELKAKGAKFVVDVKDAPVDSDITNSYLNSIKKDKPDVIFGPTEKSQLKKVVEYAQGNKILVIPPWKSISNITTENEFYIQIKPTLESYYSKMINDINNYTLPENVYLLSRDEERDRSRIESFQNLRKEITGTDDTYNTIYVDESKMLSDTSLFKGEFFNKSEDKYIIFPNWSFGDEDFLFNSLRSLNIEKGNTNIYVYGMPVLIESDKINYDLFKRLNVRVVDDNFIDDSDPLVKQFKYDFYKQFNVFPTDDAFEGYDMMMFVGSGLIDYGVMFAPFVENKKFEYTSRGYDIQANISPADDKHELPYFNYYENKDLFIIGFINNKFVKLR